ncbi:MAG: tail fiber domain-containing protein [Bacteroidia bacterium]|nr:tail fiber domain-containing protein [Bacteroidia bacterium]
MQHIKYIISLSLFICLMANAHAQVAFNPDGSDPHPSSIVDIQDSTRGMLIPRMSLQQRDAIASPATGLLVYVSDENRFFQYDGNNWIRLGDDLGNHLLSQTLQTRGNFISGDQDAEGIFVDSLGRVGIGNGSPQARLHLSGDLRLENGTEVNNYVLTTDANGNASWKPVTLESILLPANGEADLSCPKLSISLPLGILPRDIQQEGNTVFITVASTTTNGLYAYDVSNPRLPIFRDSILFSTEARPVKFAISGGIAYILEERRDSIMVVDVSNPDSLFQISSFSFRNFHQDSHIAIHSQYAYIADAETQNFRVVDISNPAQLNLVGTVPGFSAPKDLQITDSIALVIDDVQNMLTAFSLSNPTNPTVVGTKGTGVTPRALAVKGQFAYVVDQGTDDLRVYDISDPSNINDAVSLPLGEALADIFILDSYALVVTHFNRLKVVEISDPLNPILRGELALSMSHLNIIADNGFAFLLDALHEELEVVQLRCPLYLGINSGSANIQSSSAGWTIDSLKLFPTEVSQNVGIGTANPLFKLQVGEQGDGTAARANSWTTWSDSSLKRDWQEIPEPLALLAQINGYYYHWKDKGMDSGRQLGVLAQEIEQVLPELVHQDEEGIRSVDYAKLSALLIEANQALMEESAALKAKLEAQERRFGELEARLGRLEALGRK